jgi:hypothetical protein
VLVVVTGSRLILQIEAHADGEGIAGRLCDGSGEEHRFTGWLGLLTLLEQARVATAAERSGDPNDRRGVGS